MKVTSVMRRLARRSAAKAETLCAKAERAILFNESLSSLSPKQRQLIQRNSLDRNSQRNRRAFILGNGPSLAAQDLSILKDEITVCVNAFHKHDVVSVWQPTYYLLTDDNLFTDDSGVDEMYEMLLQRTPESQFMFPVHHYRRVIQKFPEARFVGLNGFLHRHGDNFDFDFTKVLPSASTVVQTGLLWAIWIGANPIYLLGCDHNWLDDFGHDQHFYTGPTARHLQEGAENPYRTDYMKLTEYVTQMWRGYGYIAKHARANNVQIFNATQGGRLDVFERVKLEDIF